MESEKKDSQVENKPEPPKEVLEDKIKSDEGKKTEKITITNFYKKAAHPGICVFTFIFKLAAVICFIFMGIVAKSDSVVYLAVIILGAVDFWMTKNISGRVLVGLRWWNEVKENGEEVWIFESKNERMIFVNFF